LEKNESYIIVYSRFVLLSECHEWFATPISVHFPRGVRVHFCSKSCIGGELMAGPSGATDKRRGQAFPGDFGFYCSNLHSDSPSFLKLFSECWLVGPLKWPVGPFHLRFPLAQTSSFVTGRTARKAFTCTHPFVPSMRLEQFLGARYNLTVI